MGVHDLKKGGRLMVGGEPYEIMGPYDLQSVTIKNVGTGEVKIVAVADLGEILKNGDGTSLPPPDEMSDENLAVARKRFEIIAPVLGEGRTRKQVEQRASVYRVGASTIYRWIKRYLATQQLSALSPSFDLRGGKGKSRLDPAAEAIVQKVIEDCYLTRQRKDGTEICREVAMRCKSAGVRVPHANTIRNRITALPDKEVVKRREGSRKSSRIFSSVEGTFPDGKYPLDAIQIDHTILDIMLVDEVHRKPIGRPYITLAMDVSSRFVYGFYLSLDRPGFFAVGQALAMGILPKDPLLKRLGVDGAWEIFGLPKAIFADNAGEFRGEDIKAFCEEYGIEIAWRPVARPQFGGHIERLVGNLNNAIHNLPGTTFSNVTARGDYNSDKEAVFTFAELEKWIVHYLVDVYHNKDHSTLGMSPRKKYEEMILGTESVPGIGLPSVVDDEERLRVSLLPSFRRRINREGVVSDGIHYFHDVLRRYISQSGQKTSKDKFTFRQDPRDISRVYFYDPGLRQYYTIPYRNLGYPPMSIWELREVRRNLRDKGLGKPNEHQIFQAHENLKKLELEAAAKTKLARRGGEAKKQRKASLTDERDHAETLKKEGKVSRGAVAESMDAKLDELFANVKPFQGIEVLRDQKRKYEDY
ncbi:Mu transposase C-terminal domain-containing protein [Thiovibrio sp. JS02]